jgi:hypothetical protein
MDGNNKSEKKCVGIWAIPLMLHISEAILLRTIRYYYGCIDGANRKSKKKKNLKITKKKG